MNREQAKELIKNTFEASFDKEKFIIFIKNLLNHIEESPFLYRGNTIPQAFNPYIKTLERIGKYADGKNEIDLLIVKLKRATSLERARTMQRNFIAWYLKGSRGGIYKNAALVAFVSPDKEDWRFSLVKVDYVFDENGKVIEEKSPARRWSFLVGKNEKSHTAQSRLVSILEDDKNNPTLTRLEETFNIEPVTKEFFDKYRKLLVRTVDALDKAKKENEKIRKDFESNNIDTVNFAKKLLGQIIFLYFLQKKGWFGVLQDKKWGEGDKNFIRTLFEKCKKEDKNFFNNYLEILFYNTLNNPRTDQADPTWSKDFNCKIPFLNGGLFEPIGGYDWAHTHIALPDELFSNNRNTPEGDIGDGILDVFDRFNFTVKEDEPLEKEVAIDPELLGKLYEKFNAIRKDNFYEYKKALASGKKSLEKQFNKKFGVYYTPREIVHYMCQQSLVNYLHTALNQELMKEPARTPKQIKLIGPQEPEQLKIQTKKEIINKEDIEILIKYGELFAENEAAVEKKGKETKTYKYKLSESVRKNAKVIDEKLKDVRVCDPAVGSGAFLVGMMHEIVKARNVLSPSPNDSSPLKGEDKGEGERESRTPYNFKRECIENSLYGVDIDSGAVEVAKLRLWLSLIVDEEDIEKIKTLPNLDYKIMQGNSLISEFMGVNLDVEIKDKLFKDEEEKLIKQFQEKKRELLKQPDREKKENLRKEIEELIIKIFEAKLKRQKTGYFNKLKSIEEKYSAIPNEKERNEMVSKEKEQLYKKTGFNLEQIEEQLKEYTSGRKIRPFFPWKLYFAEVFTGENPGFDIVIANPPYINVNQLKDKDLYRALYDTAFGSYDIYVLFFEKSAQVLRPKGVLTFITSNKYFTTDYAKKLREFMIANLRIHILLDLADCRKVFENVLVSPAVIIITKVKQQNYKLNLGILQNEDVNVIGQINLSNITINELVSKEGTLDIYSQGNANNVLKNVRKNTIPLQDIAEVRTGVMGFEYWNLEPFIKEGSAENHIRIITNSHIEPFTFLFGKKINLYKKHFTNPYINFAKAPINETTKQFFRSRKIIVRGVAKRLSANIDTEGFALLVAVHGIVVHNGGLDSLYLLGLLNSNLFNWYHRIKLYSARIPKGSLKYPISFLKHLPIKKCPVIEQKPIINLVNKILSLTQSEDYLENPQKQAKVKEYERQIDQLVYNLYGLTNEEIKYNIKNE